MTPSRRVALLLAANAELDAWRGNKGTADRNYHAALMRSRRYRNAIRGRGDLPKALKARVLEIEREMCAKPGMTPTPRAGRAPAPRRRPKAKAMAMFNWFHILNETTCTGCGMPKEKRRKRDWRRSLCDQCERQLPPNVAWHLFTARSNCWFMRWWRVAKAIIRRNARGIE